MSAASELYLTNTKSVKGKKYFCNKEQLAVEFVVFCGRLVAPENTTQEGTIYIYGSVSGRWFGVVWSGVVWWCVHLRVCKWVMVSQNWPLLPSHCTQRTVNTGLVNEQHNPSNGTNESFHPLSKAMR